MDEKKKKKVDPKKKLDEKIPVKKKDPRLEGYKQEELVERQLLQD